MKHHVGKSVALIGALAFACAAPPAESQKIAPELEKFVLSDVPADVQTPTFVDFGGKVHLLGWELSPKGDAKPDTSLSLKLYWRPVKKVDRGYHLFTRLTERDVKHHEFNDVGPLRETASEGEFGKTPRFPPSAWTPGLVYVDEQTFTVPAVESQTVTLSVGLKRDAYAPDGGALEKVGEFNLEVLSGVSDGKHGALLARLKTGVSARQALRQKAKEKDGRRRPGAERRPGSPLGRGPMGRVPGSDKENPQ